MLHVIVSDATVGSNENVITKDELGHNGSYLTGLINQDIRVDFTFSEILTTKGSVEC